MWRGSSADGFVDPTTALINVINWLELMHTCVPPVPLSGLGDADITYTQWTDVPLFISEGNPRTLEASRHKM